MSSMTLVGVEQVLAPEAAHPRDSWVFGTGQSFDPWDTVDEGDLAVRHRSAIAKRRVKQELASQLGSHEDRARRALAVIKAACEPCEPFPWARR